MTKYSFCTECPLVGAPGPVPGSGTPGGLVIVGEAPGREEISQGKPFVGRSGKLLRETLKLLGVEDYYLTNAALCWPGSERAPDAQSVRACSGRFWDELRAAQPKVLVLVGNTAIKAVFPEERTGVLKLRGSILRVEQLGIYAVPTVHPAAVLRDPRLFKTFSRDLEKAIRALESPPTLPSPPRVRKIITARDLASLDLTRDSDGSGMGVPLSGDHCENQSRHSENPIVLDIETTGVDPFVDRILRIGLLRDPREAVIVYPSAWATQFGRWQLQALLENRSIFWVGHNGGLFDSKFLTHQLGIDWRPSFDTMLAHYTVDEESQTHSLKQLAIEYFNAPMYREELVKHQQSNDVKFEQLPDDLLDRYLAWDLLFTWMLVPELERGMAAEKTRRVHDDLLVPASLALRDVELCGIRIDTEYLIRLREQFRAQVDEKVVTIRTTYSLPSFNPNSPKQVGDLLYKTARLPDISGTRSTAREVLEKLDHPLVKEILEIRTTERLISTYIDGLIKRLGPDGRIRTDFLLHRSTTGRLSSSNPNLQNIPILYGPQIRDAFIATDGWKLVEADFSQLELRVAAWYSQDATLCQAYQTGQDIHTLVASEIYKKPIDQVTKLERYMAKYVDFGILYGRGPKTLAEQIGSSYDEAKVYIDRFFERFSGVYQWLQEQRRLAISRGYVETPLGRRRRFSLITEDNRADVEHQAGNSPIQSLASDICLHSLILLHSRLDPRVARILSTVHDSILLEIRDEAIDDTLPIITQTMTNELPIEDRGVPFTIDIEVGTRWGSLIEF